MASIFQMLGVGEFEDAVKGVVTRCDSAAGKAVAEIAHLVEAAAKQEASGPARWRKGRNFPREGGPGVVTGSHRRSYHVEGPARIGLTWTALVGPSMVYSRALELGHPRWNRTGGYPALEPALMKVQPLMNGIWSKSWSNALKGGS